jgi:transcriptional regulator with XRE-family HTH domain
MELSDHEAYCYFSQMPLAKNNKPFGRETGSAAGSSIAGQSDAPSADHAWEKRSNLGPRLRIAIAISGLTHSAFAERVGVGASQVSNWLAGNNAISAKHLHSIGKVSGVSIDWLLGFKDVPKLRSDRSTIGSLATEVRQDVERRRPVQSKELDIPIPEDGAVLLTELSAAWWDRARLRKAQALETCIGALASRMEADIPLARDFTEHFLEQIRELRSIVWRLRSPDVQWGDLSRVAKPATLWIPSRLPPGGVEAKKPHSLDQDYYEYESPFTVLGGFEVGFGWRGEPHDQMWFIDAKTWKVRYVRRRHFLTFRSPRELRGLAE